MKQAVHLLDLLLTAQKAYPKVICSMKDSTFLRFTFDGSIEELLLFRRKMTTRLFRLWQPGNPRRRVFLPNFWMAPVKPHEHEFLRRNQVKFACPME